MGNGKGLQQNLMENWTILLLAENNITSIM